jgi:ROK family
MFTREPSTAEPAYRDGVIGVDVGGSKVAACVVGRDGRILSQVRAAMAASGHAAEGLAAVTSVIDSLLNANPRVRSTIHGVGICSPGPLDPKTGVVINPPNLPCWRNYPLAVETDLVAVKSRCYPRATVRMPELQAGPPCVRGRNSAPNFPKN